MKRLIAGALALLLLVLPCLFFTGCSFGDKGYRVSYDIAARPQNLDPQTAAESAALLIIHSIFEGLYTISADGTPEPALAAGCSISADGLRYTITLREDASWAYEDASGKTDPRPVTAADFVFAFRRLLRPDTNSVGADRYFCIKNAAAVHEGALPENQLGVTAQGERQILFELESPNEEFLSLLSSSYAMPCNEDFFNETRGKYGLDPSTVMANGPFELTGWSDTSVRLNKNAYYYGAEEVLPDGVTLPIQNGDGASSLERLNEGNVHAALLDGRYLANLRGKGFNTEAIRNTTWGLYLNQRNLNLANGNIRTAIRYAFDRSAYASSLPENLAVADGLIPPDVSLFGKSYRDFAGEAPSQQFDAARAYEAYKSGLDELNTRNITGLRLLVNKDAGIDAAEYFRAVSQVLQRELSLFINVDEVDGEEYEKRIRTGDFDLAVYRVQASDNTPWPVLSCFLSASSSNYAGYYNPEVDKLLTGAASRKSGAEALADYAAAEKLILEDAVFIPMFYGTDYFVTASNVTGVTYNRQTGLVDFRAAVVS